MHTEKKQNPPIPNLYNQVYSVNPQLCAASQVCHGGYECWLYRSGGECWNGAGDRDKEGERIGNCGTIVEQGSGNMIDGIWSWTFPREKASGLGLTFCTLTLFPVTMRESSPTRNLPQSFE